MNYCINSSSNQNMHLKESWNFSFFTMCDDTKDINKLHKSYSNWSGPTVKTPPSNQIYWSYCSNFLENYLQRINTHGPVRISFKF